MANININDWKVNDVYNIEWTDGGTFFMQPTYTCKYCGYIFDGHNECGSWNTLEKSPSEKNNDLAVEHILKYHKRKNEKHK